MANKVIALIVYPALQGGMSFKEKDLCRQLVKEKFESLKDEDIDEVFEQDLSLTQIKRGLKVNVDDKKEYFELAKRILGDEINAAGILALAEVGKYLGIPGEETGFTFDIYDKDAVLQFDYKKTIIRFSMIAGVIGFIPLIPVSDLAILTPLQVGMVAKIGNLYGFDFNPKEFVKMALGTFGAGLVLQITSKFLFNLVPILGWAINGSIAFAGTYAIGILAKRYIDAGGNLSKEKMDEIWKSSYAEGKEEFSHLKDYIWEKKDELVKEFEKYQEKSKETKKEKDNES